MKLSYVLSSISVALYASTASALNPLVIKGNKFFDEVTGDQFFIKGVAYQPSAQTGPNKDPLSNIVTCKRDIAYFKDLGLNTIRVYEVDNTLNHDACMSALADAGIYVVLDISTPADSINRLDPVYDLKLLNHYKKTVDAFADYTNVLGFFAGNEVINQVNATSAAPFVKASIRDLKKYMKTKKRQIPIGYSTSDDATIRVNCQNYLNCGPEDERIDFYGYNLYSWCGNKATFQSSQYAARTEQFSTYSAPVFLSEFGCNTNGVRTFHQVKSIFGPDMENTFSGGIVYEYTQEVNDYGLVSIGPNGQVFKRPDYHYLKQELASVHPTILKESSYTPSPKRTPSQCPVESATWLASTNLPPTPSEELCASMVDSLKCVYSKKPGNTPDMSKLFNWLCSEVSCTDIAVNGRTGIYGKYSGCNGDQRLSYMFNEYYIKNGEKASTCDFQGLGSIVTPTKPKVEASTSTETKKTSTHQTSSTHQASPTVITTDKSTKTTTKSTETENATETHKPTAATSTSKSTVADETHKSTIVEKTTEAAKTTSTDKATETYKNTVVDKSTAAESTVTHKSTEAEKATETHKSTAVDSTVTHKSTETEKATETNKTTVVDKSTAADSTVTHKSTEAEKATETYKTTVVDKSTAVDSTVTHKSTETEKATETHKTTVVHKSTAADSTVTHKSTETEKATETHKATEIEKTTETHKATEIEKTSATETHKPAETCVPSTVTVTETVTFSETAPTETACVSGRYECVDSGKSNKFTVCANGRIIHNVCAPGTVCKSFEGSIICDWP